MALLTDLEIFIKKKIGSFVFKTQQTKVLQEQKALAIGKVLKV